MDPDEFVEYRLVRLADLMRRRFDDALRPHGLTARQFSVLAVLRARPGVTSAELARAVLLAPQSMGALLDQLERAGLVRPRHRGGKGVRSPVELTSDGDASLDAAARAVRDLDDRTRQALGPDLASFTRGLESLTTLLEETR